MNKADCQEIKCKDYLTDEGDPAWCYRAGQPAEVAALKCPQLPTIGKEGDVKNERNLEKISHG
jgi:hypothetical protein